MAQAHAWSMPALRNLGHGTRSFCSWDEDSITMGVQAVRNCLDSEASASFHNLSFASTTAPFADLQNASIVARAVNFSETTRTQDYSGSTRSGLSAMITALESQPAPDGLDSLIVASDNRVARPGSTQEMHYGAGAAAVRIGEGDDVIARVLASNSSNNQFIDHYRTNNGDHDYYWEERWIRNEGYLKAVPSCVKKLLDQTSIEAGEIAHFCMPGYSPRLASTLAKKIGISADSVVDNLAADIGDTGTPQPLLMMSLALDKAQPGEKILIVGFGAGVDTILLETTDALQTYQKARGACDFSSSLPAVEHYNKFLAFYDKLELDWGIRSETDNRVALTQLNRAQDQVTGFNAGECPQCGAIQFPVLSTCVKCGNTEPMKRSPLADQSAKIATVTSDSLQYYPAPPMIWGLVQFDNGARLLMEIIEADFDRIETGTELRMVFRIKQKDSQRGLHRYFWKAVPA